MGGFGGGDAAFEESKHPRSEGGQFIRSGEGSGAEFSSRGPGEEEILSGGRRGPTEATEARERAIRAVRRGIENHAEDLVFYHGTSSSFVKDIAREGLVIKESSKRPGEEGFATGARGKSIFMTTSIGVATEYAKLATHSLRDRGQDSEAVILEIHVPASEVKRVKADTESPGYAWQYRGKIPPDWIKNYRVYKGHYGRPSSRGKPSAEPYKFTPAKEEWVPLAGKGLGPLEEIPSYVYSVPGKLSQDSDDSTTYLVVMSSSKLSHADVAFEHPARGPHHCSECARFEAPDACELVESPIAPEDWCERFLEDQLAEEPAA
jgi:hypothetical protein